MAEVGFGMFLVACMDELTCYICRTFIRTSDCITEFFNAADELESLNVISFRKGDF